MLLSEGLQFGDHDRFAYGYGYFLPWKDAMVPRLESHRVPVTCFGARTNAGILLSGLAVARHLTRWKADLLHCHMPMAGVVGRVAGRIAGVPVLYTEHNKMQRFHPVSRWLNLASWKWQEQVIAVSADVADSIRERADAAVPVRTILNGTNLDHFRRDAVDGQVVRRQLGIQPTAPVIGTVAVFRVQKRLDDWLDAAVRIRAQCPECHFVIVGDGPLRAELVDRARQLGLGGFVHFPGLQDDVRPYLAAMDIYMMSSLFEGLPVALLEAMAMECAIVSTDVGGIPEAVDASNGVLVKPCDPEQLAAAAVQALASPDTLRRLGANARQTVDARFSLRRMTLELEETYLNVYGRTRSAN